MDSNKDIKIFVVNSDSLKPLLNEIGYDVRNDIFECTHILIDDTKDDYDVNLYRPQMKYALSNDIAIVFSSNGIPCFVNQYEDGTYFSKLFLDDNKYVATHWEVNPPEGIDHSPKRFNIFPPGREPKYFVEENDNRFSHLNDRDRCCFARWKGLYY